MSPDPSRRDLRREAGRRRLYDTAIALIEARGYDATTVRDITSEAGVALGTFFNHFPSKEHLLVDYHVQLQADLARRLDRPRRSFRAFLKAFSGLLAAEVRAHPHLYRAIGAHLLSSGALQAAEREACSDMHRRLAAALAEAREKGQVRAAADPEAVASLILLAHNGAILDALPDLRPAAFEARVRHYLDPLAALLEP